MPVAYAPGTDPTTLHFGMFLATVQKLASEEQNKMWLKDIRSLKMMGCYC